MANTYTCLHYHIIFSTKDREPWLRKDAQPRVWSYLGGIARENHINPLCIGGMEDHLHMLLGLPPNLSVSDAVKRVKGGSSLWVKETFPGCLSFAWQDGYGAFAVSKSLLTEVDAYIRGQAEHHRFRTFREEYCAFLDKHGISYDERYLLG